MLAYEEARFLPVCWHFIQGLINVRLYPHKAEKIARHAQ